MERLIQFNYLHTHTHTHTHTYVDTKHPTYATIFTDAVSVDWKLPVKDQTEQYI